MQTFQRPSEWDQSVKVQDDPLSFKQHCAIIEFVYPFKVAILKHIDEAKDDTDIKTQA